MGDSDVRATTTEGADANAAPDAWRHLEGKAGLFTTSPFGRCRYTRLPIATRYLVIAALLTVAGLAGVDRWIYDLTLRYVNTPNPMDRDFHQRTWYIFYGLRFFGLLWGGGVIYFLVLALHRDGLRIANRGLLAVIIAGSVCFILSRLIGRIRPNQSASALSFEPFGRTLLNDVGVCMPSSEVTVAFAVAAVLSFAWRRWTP